MIQEPGVDYFDAFETAHAAAEMWRSGIRAALGVGDEVTLCECRDMIAALREGRRDTLASLIGLRPDEAEAAEKLHVEGMGGRAYCAPLPWEPQVAPTLIGDGADPGEIEIIRRPVAVRDEE